MKFLGIRHRSWRRGPAGRAAAVLGIIAIAPGVLTACSPRAVGVIGLTTDPAGNLVALTDGCGEKLDYLVFTRTSNGGPIATAANGQLVYDSAELGRFQLSGEQQESTVIGRLPALEQDATYSVGAWDDGQSVSTGVLSFDKDGLVALDVGRVHRPTSGPESRSAAASGTVGPGMTVEQWLGTPCSDKR